MRVIRNSPDSVVASEECQKISVDENGKILPLPGKCYAYRTLPTLGGTAVDDYPNPSPRAEQIACGLFILAVAALVFAACAEKRRHEKLVSIKADS